ncbi:MAG TPA: nucleotide exchange factor GrpE [Thermoanaerobaculia bacterium]|jgi:molecular chaperone GrpE|nr:nucleotide exchange factor GrpE [Thermoanaerobaculia bacterium]
MTSTIIDRRESDTSGELGALTEEVKLLRKAVLRQGHAQELFQARVDAAVGQLAAASQTSRPLPPAAPGSAQVRVLLELDQAVLQLLRLVEGDTLETEPEEDAPRSLREGLSLLQVRVSNLQRSLGLTPIPARNLPFDDRRHEACGVVRRPDLPDRWVVEEILPGYLLGDRVVRPARVVVNLHS